MISGSYLDSLVLIQHWLVDDLNSRRIVMKIKSKFFAIGIPVLFTTTALYAAEGEHSTVNFTGNIFNTTCALKVDSRDKIIDMGSVATSAFSGTGSTSEEIEFTIDYDDCLSPVTHATSQNVWLTFSGETMSDSILRTSDSDTTKVGVQILQDGQPIILDGVTPTKSMRANDSSINWMYFSVRYIALADTVTAGEANAIANFTLHYE